MQPGHQDDLATSNSLAVAEPGARVGRPSFALTDDQSRSLIQQLEAIKARHAGNDTRHHRPFVHDFLRAVYHATGKIHSAGIYRRLLKAYAEECTPSTTTIETEKNLLEHELRHAAIPCEVPPPQADSGASRTHSNTGSTFAEQPNLAQLQAIALLQHLAARLDQMERTLQPPDRSSGLREHNAFLENRLRETEDELAKARTLAARMTATAQAEASLAAERGLQLEALHASAKAQAEALAKMAASIDGDRQFFAMQVDGVRGETRAVRDRCAHLEAMLKEKEEQVELYRRMAYSKGAAQ